jgi:hypothetical protein
MLAVELFTLIPTKVVGMAMVGVPGLPCAQSGAVTNSVISKPAAMNPVALSFLLGVEGCETWHSTDLMEVILDFSLVLETAKLFLHKQAGLRLAKIVARNHWLNSSGSHWVAPGQRTFRHT